MRSFVIALVTLVVMFEGPFRQRAAAQTGNAAVPVAVTGGTPGVNIEVFLNSGKIGGETVSSTGNANWWLDLSQSGKTRVTTYADVCDEARIVKVKFVTGNGQPPSFEDGCARRLAGVSFQSDCVGVRVNLDFSNFGASRAIGCGSWFTDPKVIAPIGGAAVLAPFLIGEDPSLIAVAPPPPFIVTITATAWEHLDAEEVSNGCGSFTTLPVQANAPFVVQATGPGSQAAVAGTTDAEGAGIFRFRLSSLGPHSITVSVTSNGVTRSGTGNVNVTDADNTCPGG